MIVLIPGAKERIDEILSKYGITRKSVANIRISTHEAEEFLKLNTGKEQKIGLEVVALALTACRGGVNRDHIVDDRIQGVILEEIFSSLGSGNLWHHDLLQPV